MILIISYAPIRTSSTSVSAITVKVEDIPTMVARMSWYLLHPEVVPEDIRESWGDVLNKLKYVNVNEIMQAIRGLNKQPITEFGTSDTFIPQVRHRIVELLQILEGVAHANEPALRGDLELDEKLAEKPAASTFLQPSSKKARPFPIREKPPVNNSIELALLEEEKSELIGGGAIQMPSAFFQMAMGPIIEHIKHIYPVYSAIETISPSFHHDLIAPLQRLLRICSTISHEKHYGFYRISNVPLELFNYIQECITNIVDYQLYEEIPHETRTAYQYFLCLKGNISFTTVPNKTTKQKSECKAVRTYFKQNTLYLLYTTKKKLTMESYLDDPFYVYDIKYDSINDEQNVMKIKEVDSILNENPIELSRYLTAKPTGIFDEKQLELSVFHQLNRLTIL
jgi:hypothetical protein